MKRCNGVPLFSGRDVPLLLPPEAALFPGTARARWSRESESVGFKISLERTDWDCVSL